MKRLFRLDPGLKNSVDCLTCHKPMLVPFGTRQFTHGECRALFRRSYGSATAYMRMKKATSMVGKTKQNVSDFVKEAGRVIHNTLKPSNG